MTINEESVFFVTIDSCRYDNFELSNSPNMKSVGLSIRLKLLPILHMDRIQQCLLASLQAFPSISPSL